MVDFKRHINNPRDNAHYQWVMGNLQKHGCTTMLDLGPWDCWLGLLCCDAMPRLRVDCIEHDPRLVAVAVDHVLHGGANLTCRQGDIRSLPSGHWDAVVANEVLEHLPPGDVRGVIQAMGERGTICMASLPDQRHEDNLEHLWTPTEDLIGHLWAGVGWMIVGRVEYHHSTGIPANWMITWAA